MRLDIDRIEKTNSNLLGPGNRLEIWFHGCHFCCPGCITKERNASPEGLLNLSVNSIVYAYVDDEIEGVTFSGGEPLLQIKPLISLSKALKEKGKGIILFSGYTIDQITKLDGGNEMLSLVDTLIDGRYIRELDDNKPFRGSSNQKIYHLTNRYIDYYSAPQTGRDCYILQNGVYFRLTGIPDDKSKKIWEKIKQKGNE